MVPVPEEQLTTALRPVAFGALRAIEDLIPAGGVVPTSPLAQFDVDPLSQWVETAIDWARMASLAISSGRVGGSVFGAEVVLAQALGTGPHERRGAERAWTPQGQVLDTFVADFIRLAITEEASREIPGPFRNPEQDALGAAVRRLHRFLQTDRFNGTLVAPLLRAALDLDSIELRPGARIERFPAETKRELWAAHGWGSLAIDPLPGDEILTTTHAIVIDVEGQRLGGWDWYKAREQVPLALLALRLLGPGPVTAPWAMLRPPVEFADYLIRLGASGGLVSHPLRDVPRGRFELTATQAPLVPPLYRYLAADSPPAAFALALRRFTSSYQRVSDEDRLIDYWVAFEALYAPDQTSELRFRVSLRIARLLGSTRDDRVSLFAAMRRSYDWRSHIVHGGGPPAGKKKRELGPFPQTVAATEDAFRRTLLLWTDPATRPTITEIDDQLLE
jgi:hypothetical protein